MRALTPHELAFLENLLLMGVSPAHVIYLLRLSEQSEGQRSWEVSAELGLGGRDVLNQAYVTAEQALEAAGEQEFSFDQGAMVGPWELMLPRGRTVGGEAWIGRQGDQRAFVRVLLPGSGKDPQRAARFVERSNPGLEPPHPSILRIDEAAEDFGWLYTATHGFEGQTLAEILQKGPLAEQSALALAQSLAGSLQVVHGLGVVHGGLNPLAILVHQSRTYLSDFGACSGVLDGPVAGSRPGGRLGLLLYAAPGLVAGTSARGLEARDDIHALGALLYHAVIAPGGEPTRASPDAPWLVEPPVSAGTRTLLARLLAPHPDARYPTVQAVLTDLARVVQGQLPGPLPAASGQPVVSRRAPSAVPQVPLTAELIKGGPRKGTSQRAAAVVTEPADEEAGEAPGETPAAGKSDRLKAAKSDRLKAAKSDRLGKASSGAGKVLARRASDRFAAEPKQKGAGWGWLAGSMTLVGGVMLVLVFVARPDGAPLGRQHLFRAAQLGAQAAPDWHEALVEVERALQAAPRDQALLRDAIALRQELLRRAQAEVAALRAAGATDEKAWLAQRGRVAGLELEALVDWELAVLRGQTDLTAWGRLGETLREAGHAAEAAQAFEKAGRDVDSRLARVAAAMVYIPGGPALVPTSEIPSRAEGAEKAEGVTLVRREPCYLGRTEVSRGEYREFLAARARQADPHQTCDKREGEGKDHAPAGWTAVRGPDDPLPATGLDWWDAISFARWRGGLLPELAVMRHAARGPGLAPWPWGALPPSLGFANCAGELGGPAPVGSFPAGAGVGGALDLLGNAEEWCDSTELSLDSAPVFGGSWETPAAELGTSGAPPAKVVERRPTLGFRVMLPLGAAAKSVP